MNTRASQFVSVSRENSVLGLNSNSRKPAHDHTRANQFGSVSRENSGLGLNRSARRRHMTLHAQVNSSASHGEITAWRLNSNSRKPAHERTRTGQFLSISRGNYGLVAEQVSRKAAHERYTHCPCHYSFVKRLRILPKNIPPASSIIPAAVNPHALGR